jgi:hypothetical protein
MAISRIGSSSASTTSITIPGAYAAGDLMLIFAPRNNTTPASIPSDWTLASSASGIGGSMVVAFKFARSSSETSGTWTNAVALHCGVYRASVGSITLGYQFTTGAATSATISYSALAAYRAAFLDNWYATSVIQLNSANSLETAPSGMTNLSVESSAGVWKSAMHDTNASQLSNWATTNVVLANSAAYRLAVVQLYELDLAPPSYGGGGGGGGLILPRAMNGGYSA